MASREARVAGIERSDRYPYVIDQAMSKRSWIVIALLIGMVVTWRACQLSEERIRAAYWQKLDDAGCPGWGDFLFLDGSYVTLRNDTVYRGDTAIAELLKARWELGGERMYLRVFCSGNEVEFIPK